MSSISRKRKRYLEKRRDCIIRLALLIGAPTRIDWFISVHDFSASVRSIDWRPGKPPDVVRYSREWRRIKEGTYFDGGRR
jgi:hypothetical protein